MSSELAIVIKASALTGAATTAVRALGGSLGQLGRNGSIATSKLGREYGLLTRRAEQLNSKLFDVSAFAASKRVNQRLSESYTQAQDKAQGLNRSLSQAKQFATQSQSALTAYRNELANQTGKATDAQKLKLKLLGDQAKAAQADIGRLTAEFSQARGKVREFSTRLEESRLSLQAQRAELQKNGIATTQLATHKSQLIRQLEQEQSRISSLGKTYAALGRTQKSIDALQVKRTALQAHGAELKGEVMGAVAAAGTVAFPIKAAMEFESEMANVKKVVTFESPAQFKEMERDVLELTRTIPMAGTELASIVAQGGQAGIEREKLKGFATDAAKMGIAFDMAASEAGTAMAGLSNVLKIPIADIGNLGDKINHLADNANSNARDIVNVLTRVGSATKQFGLSDSFSAALSSTYLSMNKPPELAAQAINGMMQTMSLAKVGEFDGELKKIGMTTKGFADAVKKDADSALIGFIERVKKLPKDEQYPFLISMFGKNYADDIMLITSNTEELTRQVKSLKDTGADGKPLFEGSMTREFNNQSATTANQLKIFKNGAMEVAITVGNQMLPALNDLLHNTIIPLTHRFANFMQKHPGFAKGLVTIVAALAGFKVVGLAVRGLLYGINLATLGGKIRILAFAKALLQGKGALQALRLGLNLSSRTLLRQHGLLGQLARGFAHVSRFAGSAAGAIKKFAGTKLGQLARGFAHVSRFAGSAAGAIKKFAGTKLGKGVGKGLGAAAGAYGLYDIYKKDKNAGAKNQTTGQKVASYAQGALSGAAIGMMFGPVGAAIGAVLGLIYTAVVRNWDAIKTTTMTKLSELKLDVVNKFNEVTAWFNGLPATFTQLGANIMDGLWGGLKSAFEKVKAWWSEVSGFFSLSFAKTNEVKSPSRVFRRLGGYLTEGLHVGLAKGAPKPLATIGKMAGNLQQRFKNRAGELSTSLSARMQANAAELAQARAQAQSSTGAGSYVIHYSPQISAPNATAGNVEQIKDALRLSQREFEAMFERMVAGQARRAY